MPLPASFVEIHAQCAIGLRLQKGDVLHVIDPYGEQVADVAIFDAASRADGFSPGRTIDYNESLAVTRGSVLYSNGGLQLAHVVEDTVGVHDLMIAPCSRAMFARRGEFGHPSCHANLTSALADFGIRSDLVTATLNLFMNVSIEDGGRITLRPPASKAGDSIALEALRSLVVGVAACSSELTNNGRCKPVCYALLRAET